MLSLLNCLSPVKLIQMVIHGMKLMMGSPAVSSWALSWVSHPGLCSWTLWLVVLMRNPWASFFQCALMDLLAELSTSKFHCLSWFFALFLALLGACICSRIGLSACPRDSSFCLSFHPPLIGMCVIGLVKNLKTKNSMRKGVHCPVLDHGVHRLVDLPWVIDSWIDVCDVHVEQVGYHSQIFFSLLHVDRGLNLTL